MKRIKLIWLFTFFIANIFSQQIVIKPITNNSNKNAPFNDDSSLFPDKHGIFGECEKEPAFVGGSKAYHNYFNKNIKWPYGISKTISGKVVIKFVVEKNGKITHANVIHSFNKLFNASALNAVNKMPKWKPGTNENKPERCYYSIPVSFVGNKQ